MDSQATISKTLSHRKTFRSRSKTRINSKLGDETTENQCIYEKQDKASKQRSVSSKGISKNKLSSKKMFANAKTIQANETLFKKSLISKSEFQTISHKNLGVIPKCSLQVFKKNSTDTCDSPEAHSGKVLDKIKKLQKRSLEQEMNPGQKQRIEPTIRNVASEKVLRQLSKAIYGETKGEFEDVSFEFIEESSIHGEEKDFFLDVKQTL